ncbi:MAG: histidinol dehydrogenase, partial [Gammaproteobacteria bacterium]
MSKITLTRLDAESSDFAGKLDQLLAWNESEDLSIHQRVLEIIAAVRTHGDQALLDYTNRFDQRGLTSASELELRPSQL